MDLIAITFNSRTNLVDLLHGQAARFADKTVLRFLGDREDQAACLAYSELDRQARAVGTRRPTKTRDACAAMA